MKLEAALFIYFVVKTGTSLMVWLTYGAVREGGRNRNTQEETSG